MWTKGIKMILHAEQDINSFIEFYHGAMNRWFGFTTNELQGRRLD